MKPYVKAFIFLGILTILDLFFRKGLVGHFLPFRLPANLNILLLFTVFAICAWYISGWYIRAEQKQLSDLGISWDQKNRKDFLIGLLIGAALWSIVSLSQAYFAGFSWELRPSLALFNLAYGLFFIFIADLGTELFTRGYPLTKLKESFGAKIAIAVMVLFVSLKSYSPGAEGALLLYSILIPALHTIFFSIIYFKTGRLGASLGVHTGANFATISIFDLRTEQIGQAIPAGLFQANVEVESLSIHCLQAPWMVMAILFSITTYYWWTR